MSDGCRWIEGEPGEVLFRGEAIYCGALVSAPGSSWCEHHRVRVYPPAVVQASGVRALPELPQRKAA